MEKILNCEVQNPRNQLLPVYPETIFGDFKIPTN